jgi:hypothetical protein
MSADIGRLTIRNGDHTVEVFDPRMAPEALGARYVHGGYIASWRAGDRCLTGRPRAEWNPYEGEGMPEVFEYGLGWGAACEGEEFLRIGAGRLRKQGRNWPQVGGEPTSTVSWTLAEHSQTSLVMRCRDEVMVGDSGYKYELDRHVIVHPDGVESRTRLWVMCPWSHPVIWFAHPFFAHCDGCGTALRSPSGALPSQSLHASDEAERIMVQEGGGFGAVTGLWGQLAPLELELDTRIGGGLVRIEVSKPIDKLVVFATPRVFSVEPYISRAWHDDEEAEWSVRYRFVP